MKLKQFILLFSLLLFTAYSCVWVKPQEEGVLMTNCGRNGLSDFKIVTGKINTWGVCTELIKVPMFERRADVPKIKVTTRDGGVFDIDPFYSYTPIRGKGPEIAFTYKQYAEDVDFLGRIEENILNPRVLNVYREEARNYTTDSLMRNMNEYEGTVAGRLKVNFEMAFFQIIEINSGLTPPESMQKAIEDRNRMLLESEKVQQQLQREKAQLAIQLEKARVEVEIAKFQAEANLQKARGLTPEVLQEMAIKGWIEKGCPMPAAVGSSGFYQLVDPKK